MKLFQEEQISMEENPTYAAFVEKFKPKKTTDDCYTPENVYNAVRAWAVNRYGLHGAEIVRPFWPCADYRKMDYPEGGVVIDNPPFSILSKIVDDFNRAGVRFFLFAPYLTLFGKRGCCHIVTETRITYQSGAEVNTGFLTNMEPGVLVRADPELAAIIRAENEKNLKTIRKQNPKYEYPAEVLTSTMAGYMAAHGVPFTLLERDAVLIDALDSQKEKGKGIFGHGYLLSEKAAAEKSAAERQAEKNAAAERLAREHGGAEIWTLSAREREIVKTIGRKRPCES